MIIRIVKMTFKPEHVPAFLEVFEQSKSRIRNFDGCRHLELLNDIDQPNIYFTYSHWDSQAHLNAYRDSELFGDVWPRTKTLFAARPEAWSVTQKHILA